MAYPSFSKTGVASVTLSRGDAFPRAQDADEGQIVGRSTAGVRRVATLRSPEKTLKLAWPGNSLLPHADYLALVAFLEHPLVNLRANTFTYTDVDSTAYTVRYDGGLYQFQRVAFAGWQGTLALLIEG